MATKLEKIAIGMQTGRDRLTAATSDALKAVPSEILKSTAGYFLDNPQRAIDNVASNHAEIFGTLISVCLFQELARRVEAEVMELNDLVNGE